MLENNYYSYDKYGFLMNEPLTGSLYELLAEKKGVICDHVLKSLITVTSAHGELVKLLQVSMGAPLFVMDSVMGTLIMNQFILVFNILLEKNIHL